MPVDVGELVAVTVGVCEGVADAPSRGMSGRKMFRTEVDLNCAWTMGTPTLLWKSRKATNKKRHIRMIILDFMSNLILVGRNSTTNLRNISLEGTTPRSTQYHANQNSVE